jgi:arginine decarboxylase
MNIYLKYNKEKPLYIGFFNTGAIETVDMVVYTTAIPQQTYFIDRDENGILEQGF